MLSDVKIFVTLLVLTQVLLSFSEDRYRFECQVWLQEIKRIQSDEQRVNVSCQVNSECSGIDCNGKYSYEGLLTAGSKYEKDICFGMWLDPCVDPTKLTLYLIQKQDNIVYQKTVDTTNSHSEEEIPGMGETVEIPFLGSQSVKVVVAIDCKPITIQGKPYVTIGVQVKPKLVSSFGTSHFLDDLQVWLVKDTDVPVPPCNPNVPKPSDISTCPDIDPSKIPPMYVTGTPTPQPAFTGSPGKCKSYLECKHNEMCTLGSCECVPGYSYDIQGNCVEPIHKPTSIPVIAYPDFPADNSGNDPNKSSKSKNVAIIGSCSALAVLLALAATAFVIYKYWKHRSRYASQMNLVEGEEDNSGDVPPINLDT